MKIGILSMQRIVNYGSFLQAYSLKKTLENLGHDVVFVDYKVEPEKEKRKKFISMEKIMIHLNHKKSFANKTVKAFYKDFERTYFAWLGLKEKENYCENVDILIIGSDEVFRGIKRNEQSNKLCTELFGDYPYAKKVITFAASAGNTTLETMKNEKIVDQAVLALNHITSFSVRDENTAKIIKALVNENVKYHIDPVFMYDYIDEMPTQCKYQNYILLYGYNYRFTNQEIKEIKKFAQKRNLKIMTCGTIQKYYDICIAPNPFELLRYVRNAQYVITDTFHGTVFSIKFNKQFVTLLRDTNNIKIVDLLTRMKMTSRLCNNIENLEHILQTGIDYTETNQLIKEYRESAQKYLLENLTV